MSRQHQLEAAVDDSSSPPVVDLGALRELCALGPLPDYPPLLRQRIWRLLLGVLPPEKRSWGEFAQANHRRYYAIARRFVDDLPSEPLTSHKLGPKDQLLDTIVKDVARMKSFISQIDPPTPRAPSPSAESPEDLAPIESFEKFDARIDTLRHGAHVQPAVHVPPPQIMIFDGEGDSSSAVEHAGKEPEEEKYSFDVAASLTRILYFHANLHPDRIYNQAWPALLSPIYFVVAAHGAETGDPHQAEADAFWTFGELIGDVDPVLGSLDRDGQNPGVQMLLNSFSRRVKWADEEYWDVLSRKSLDPALPYWSFRWVSCMIAQTLPLPHTIHIWDLILAQPPGQSSTNDTPRLTFLVDICASMLLRLRPRLIVAGNRHKGGLWGDTVEIEELPDGTMGDGFVEGMKIIQAYPIDAIGVPSIVQGAWYLVNREKRQKEEEAERLRRSSAPSAYSLTRVTGSLRGFGWGGGSAASGTSNSSARSSKGPDEPSSPEPTQTQHAHPPTGKPRRGLFDVGDAAAQLSKARSNLTAAAIAWSSSPRTSLGGGQGGGGGSSVGTTGSDASYSPVAPRFDIRSWVNGTKHSSTNSDSFSNVSTSNTSVSIDSRHSRTQSASTDVSFHHPASPALRDRSALPLFGALSPPSSPRSSGFASITNTPLHSRSSTGNTSDYPQSPAIPSPFLRARSPPPGPAPSTPSGASTATPGRHSPLPPPSPNPSSRGSVGGVRPLILSTRRVTRESSTHPAALSRQSSISSRGGPSDTEGIPSRIVPLRRGRQRVVSPGSPPSSSASELKSPKSRFDTDANGVELEDGAVVAGLESVFDIQPPLSDEQKKALMQERRRTIIAQQQAQGRRKESLSPTSPPVLGGISLASPISAPGDGTKNDLLWRALEDNKGTPRKAHTLASTNGAGHANGNGEASGDESAQLHASPSLQRQSRLRAKRSLPLLDSIATPPSGSSPAVSPLPPSAIPPVPALPSSISNPIPIPSPLHVAALSAGPGTGNESDAEETDDATMQVPSSSLAGGTSSSGRHSPMTPRPPIVSQGSTGTITNVELSSSVGAGGAGVSIVRRPSPKPRRTRKVSHRSDVTARSDRERPSSYGHGHTLSSQPPQGSSSPENSNSEIAYAYMPSEEEGVKGDDEGDYSDLLSAYSTDADA